MRNRFISIVIVGILVCGIYGCAQTDEGAFTKIVVYTVDKERGEEKTEPIPNASESAEQIMSQESDPIELFNSQGVYIRLLAEGNEELSESERAEFLAAFGFEGSEPFYVHTEEDGYPFMELYFDEEREIGCGIRYGKMILEL